MNKRQRRNSKSHNARFVALDTTTLQQVGGGDINLDATFLPRPGQNVGALEIILGPLGRP